MFCGQFYVPESSALRKLDHDYIDRVINIRKHWNRKINFGGSWNNRFSPVEITQKIIDDLHNLCDFLCSDQTPKKLMIHTNHIYVYTNDPSFFERMTVGQLLETTKVEISGNAPGTVILKNPKYQYRSYFRELRMLPATADAIHNFLETQQDLRLSPSARRWCEHQYRTSQNYYFIDHNSTSILTMLAMIEPRLVRKTVPITAAK